MPAGGCFLRGRPRLPPVPRATAALPPGTARAAPSPALVTYPSRKLANLRDLKVNEPLAITYPDAGSPGVLLKLGSRVETGAGQEGDIVAFSTLCPHKGFPLFYGAGDRSLSCPGHYSRFDVEKAGYRSSVTRHRTCRSSAWSWMRTVTSMPSPSTN